MIDIESLRQELAQEAEKPAPEKQSNIGIMRALYDEINAKRTAKWRAADLVEWLAGKGVVLSENCFRNYLYQIDRERGRSRIAEREEDKAVREQKQAPKPRAAVVKTAPPAKAKTTESVSALPAKAQFPTSENAQQQTAAEQEGGEMSWDNLAAELKVEPLDEKGFVQMPGTVKK